MLTDYAERGSGRSRRRRRATIAVAAGVAALAAAATLPGAIDLPLWQDEVASARVLLESTPAGVVEHVARTESTPPGWYLVLREGDRRARAGRGGADRDEILRDGRALAPQLVDGRATVSAELSEQGWHAFVVRGAPGLHLARAGFA